MIATSGDCGNSEQRRQTPMGVALVDVIVRPRCRMVARPGENARVSKMKSIVDIRIADSRKRANIDRSWCQIFLARSRLGRNGLLSRCRNDGPVRFDEVEERVTC